MPGPRLSKNDHVLISRAGAESLETSEGVIDDASDNGLSVKLNEKMMFVSPGVLVLIRPAEGNQLVGWATVESVSNRLEFTHLTLSQLRWEDPTTQRAPRMPVDFRVIASYLDTSEPEKETKKTVGQAMNLSLTGVRIRFRSAVPMGTLVHVQLFVDVDKPSVAVGRVVRVVPGTEAATGGFDVGINFIRFLQHYDDVVELLRENKMLPQGAEGDQPQADTIPSEDSSDASNEETAA
jgi:hypothetical protein